MLLLTELVCLSVCSSGQREASISSNVVSVSARSSFRNFGNLSQAQVTGFHLASRFSRPLARLGFCAVLACPSRHSPARQGLVVCFSSQLCSDKGDPGGTWPCHAVPTALPTSRHPVPALSPGPLCEPQVAVQTLRSPLTLRGSAGQQHHRCESPLVLWHSGGLSFLFANLVCVC